MDRRAAGGIIIMQIRGGEDTPGSDMVRTTCPHPECPPSPRMQSCLLQGLPVEPTHTCRQVYPDCLNPYPLRPHPRPFVLPLTCRCTLTARRMPRAARCHRRLGSTPRSMTRLIYRPRVQIYRSSQASTQLVSLPSNPLCSQLSGAQRLYIRIPIYSPDCTNHDS